MKIPNGGKGERVDGKPSSFIQYAGGMTCFTEIHLSRAEDHSRRYGLLGVVVSRSFVLSRLGGPVMYVRNGVPERTTTAANALFNFINYCEGKGIAGAKDAKQAFGAMAVLMKGMSNTGADDFAYLEEQEWRIPHSYEAENAGLMKKPPVGFPASPTGPEYVLPLAPDEVKLLVFPDDQTRAAASVDSRVTGWLARRSGPPVMLTLDECLRF